MGGQGRAGRLQIIPASSAWLSALVEGADSFERTFGVRVAHGFVAEEFEGAVEFALNVLVMGDVPEGWWSYLFLHAEENVLVGMGGFKGAPGPFRDVELGYSIAPAYRCRGLATEAVEGLKSHAFESGEVSVVLAHTLPGKSASTRVLEKSGFAFTGEVDDSDGGDFRVWRWECATSA